MLHLEICEDSHSATSSPESASGVTRSASQDGVTIGQSGQEAAHANLSATQAKALGLMTSGTYGQRFSTSQSSASLTSSLVNRLRVKTDSLGSTLYKLTWKQRATPLGLSIPALRALALPISDSVFTGWPTVRTCKTGHTKGNPKRALKHRSRLEDAIFLLLHSQERQTASGQIVSGCVGLTDDSTQLGPEHCRWLMGLPGEWEESAPTETA